MVQEKPSFHFTEFFFSLHLQGFVNVDCGASNEFTNEKSARRFPNGTRNCCTLKPGQAKNNAYLIRASFKYRKHDKKHRTSFDLYIDVNYWATVSSSTSYEEIMYVSQADDVRVCLVNTGNGVPFITALEQKRLDDDIYRFGYGFLRLNWRYDNGGRLKSSIR
ncbi:hypothetical protein ACJRO7_021425 [Eucalyptus globulus]|uniref:Malectin-like domain-containing protein n=1 Tax=Eucalyptus globulus TaxID=34317 RepID=A0ABD3KSI2_EUCGL